jgi:hypothetical protein
MSINDLLKNKKRLGLGHYLQKIKKVEDELNSAFSHLCKVVSDTDLIATLHFNEELQRFSITLPLKRKEDEFGLDETEPFLDGIFKSAGNFDITAKDSIIEGVPGQSEGDVIQISIAGDRGKNTNNGKILATTTLKERDVEIPLFDKSITKIPTEVLSEYGIDPGLKLTQKQLTPSFRDPGQPEFDGAGVTDLQSYLEDYVWLKPDALDIVKAQVSHEIEIVDQVNKFKTWVIDPKAKHPIAKNLFQELSNTLDAFIGVLASEKVNHEAIRRIDGFALYMKQVGILKDYESFTKDRINHIDNFKQFFDLDSDVDIVKSGLPVVRKFSEYKDIGDFLNWLYSFWGSASKQSYAGRVTAILCSRPKSGTLDKSATASNQKPTGSKGKTKKDKTSSKKNPKKEGKGKPSQIRKAQSKSKGEPRGKK